MVRRHNAHLRPCALRRTPQALRHRGGEAYIYHAGTLTSCLSTSWWRHWKGRLRRRVCTARAQRRHSAHSAHMTGRNWGFLLQLAIFLPIQTILHPHNVGQPDVCKGGAQEYCNRTWDGGDSVSPRPGEPVVVWTGAVTSSPQAYGTPHNHRPATKTHEESLQHS